MKPHPVIYGLVDPRDGALRYVGKSNNPSSRRNEHLGDAGNRLRRGGRVEWLRELLTDGLTPKLIEIERTTPEHWQERERYWIAFYRNQGCALTNIGIGGEGWRPPNGSAWCPHQIKMTEAFYGNAVTAAKEDHKTFSEYVRDLIAADLERRARKVKR